MTYCLWGNVHSCSDILVVYQICEFSTIVKQKISYFKTFEMITSNFLEILSKILHSCDTESVTSVSQEIFVEFRNFEN